MADVLFGSVNPGGKLPVTIARSVGQLPLFYNHKPSAQRGYLFDTTAPLFPFGYGLSYTSFEIGAPRLSATTIGTGRSEEHTSELQSLMRISYAVFCLKKTQYLTKETSK